MAKQLQISRKRIHFAGTKDKRSISTQRFSFYKIPPKKIQQLSLKDVTISEVYRSDKKLFLGDLKGNQFKICIRNIAPEITVDDVSHCIEPLVRIGGFPNFFGIQRFGVIRPITQLVGKQIVLGDIESAVMTYLTFLDKHEDPASYQARHSLEQSHDFKTAFHEFPDYLTYEKAMLNHLQVHPDDFVGALQQLPKNLITMFTYAYQSLLFNKMISHRIKKGLPIHKAVSGDVVIQVQNDEVTDTYIPVTDTNVDKVNTQIARGKAVVSSVLVGFDTCFSLGEMGEIEQSVFEKESIDKRDFIIPSLPLASSAGTRRGIFTPLEQVNHNIKPDDQNQEKQQVDINFSLRKGSYATSFLRELMKAEDIRNY